MKVLIILWLFAPGTDYGPFMGTSGWVPNMTFQNIEVCERLRDFRRQYFPNDARPAQCVPSDELPEPPILSEIIWD